MIVFDYTLAAIRGCINQSHIDVKLLIVNQGSSDETRRALENLADVDLLANPPGSLFIWSHDPPLPSLSATWNRALDFVWEAGGEHALVVNSDVRLHVRTYATLLQVLQLTDSLLVSAVGVTEEQFDPLAPFHLAVEDQEFLEQEGPIVTGKLDKGGPDFSCFLISRKGHEKYRFDENFVPLFCEDLDSHRRYMLNGDGERIFSINLPYLHYGSGSVKALPAAKQETLHRRIEQGSRAYYKRKWGGEVNQETFTVPFDPASAKSGVTTPELQRLVLRGDACGGVEHRATSDSGVSR